MTLENLEKNVKKEKNLIQEIIIFNRQYENIKGEYGREEDKKLLQELIRNCLDKLKILNASIPELMEGISEFKSLKQKGKEKLKNLTQITEDSGEAITLKKSLKKEYMKKLRITEDILKRLKKKGKKVKKEDFMEFKKAGFYAKFSNKLFVDTSNSLLNKGYFKGLNESLRKANLPYLLTTYISMMLLSTIIAVFIGIFYFASQFLFSFTISFPFIAEPIYEMRRIFLNFLIMLGIPILTFISIYYYPFSEAKSIEKKIDNELPFVAIHMSAVAGSGIEPSHIFKIISLRDEYPKTKVEFKKIITQVNVYGYDLVTALKNTARETSSENLSELLNGMATVISSGGALTTFLDKRSESLLFEHKMEQEKKNASAETFMEIYIAGVIAAPMIITILMVLINVTGMDMGVPFSLMILMMFSIVALINIAFLAFLHLNK